MSRAGLTAARHRSSERKFLKADCRRVRAITTASKRSARISACGSAHHERPGRKLDGGGSREAIAGHAHHRIFGERHRDRGPRLHEVRAHLGHVGIADHGRRHRGAGARRQDHDPHPDIVALTGGEAATSRRRPTLRLRSLGGHGVDLGRGARHCGSGGVRAASARRRRRRWRGRPARRRPAHRPAPC